MKLVSSIQAQIFLTNVTFECVTFTLNIDFHRMTITVTDMKNDYCYDLTIEITGSHEQAELPIGSRKLPHRALLVEVHCIRYPNMQFCRIRVLFFELVCKSDNSVG